MGRRGRHDDRRREIGRCSGHRHPRPRQKRRSQVYTRDISNLYKGKQEIETYRGSSVADLIGGMAGVFSGDARNSGALDPNIRGIQGEGKVPVR